MSISLPGTRPDTRSAMKKHKDEHGFMAVFECCPFGCGEPQCDEFGYCEHLLGFTNCRLPEGELKNEPPVGAEDAFVELLVTDPKTGKRQVDGSKTLPLKKGDFLVRNTITRWVFREPEVKPTEPKVS